MGRAMTARNSAEGTVRSSTSRTDSESVPRTAGMSRRTAARESAGRLTVATATPKSPIGSCMRRNAYWSHDTLPSRKLAAIAWLTKMLSWVAASPTVAGSMSEATRRTPGCQFGSSGRSRKPSL